MDWGQGGDFVLSAFWELACFFVVASSKWSGGNLCRQRFCPLCFWVGGGIFVVACSKWSGGREKERARREEGKDREERREEGKDREERREEGKERREEGGREGEKRGDSFYLCKGGTRGCFLGGLEEGKKRREDMVFIYVKEEQEVASLGDWGQFVEEEISFSLHFGS